MWFARRSPIVLIESVMAAGFTLRVYHWGPSCQQLLETLLPREERTSAGVRSYWCVAHDAAAVKAAVRRVPTRRTEHFVLVHRDLEALSRRWVGDRAMEWLARMDRVSLPAR